jgi:hypothetical protein
MDHNHDSDASGGEAPTALPTVLFLVTLVQVLDVEHLREVLPQIVGSGGLNSASVSLNKRFHCRCEKGSCKFLIF